jgi:hypothetical protein
MQIEHYSGLAATVGAIHKFANQIEIIVPNHKRLQKLWGLARLHYGVLFASIPGRGFEAIRVAPVHGQSGQQSKKNRHLQYYTTKRVVKIQRKHCSIEISIRRLLSYDNYSKGSRLTSFIRQLTILITNQNIRHFHIKSSYKSTAPQI